MTNLPPANTPLYNHPLPLIEAWLEAQGCERDSNDVHLWQVARANWQAAIELDVEQIIVSYRHAGANGQDLTRSFKYSLSRQDIQEAIFAGP
jgi:hypothetical protein